MPRLSQKLEQKQKLAPRQVLQARLLQLNTINIEQTILKELEQNPILEQIEPEDFEDKSMAEEILDEVDAPLDDANVTRFCSLLEELTKITDTKFIIITHHALTMSKMDRLYGVTMPEKGISQLVSVDLEKAEDLVA